MKKSLFVAACFSAQAWATPVVVEHYTFPPAGQYTAVSNDVEFQAWCAEISQYLYFGETIEYTLIDGTAAWGVEKTDRLDRLLSWAAPTNTTESYAVQQDIWTILAGGTGLLNVDDTAITVHTYQLHNDTRQDLVVPFPINEPAPLLLVGLALVGAGMWRKY